MRAGQGLWSRSTLVLAVLALLACTQAARAQDATVQLSIEDCAGVPGTEIAHLVALELAPRARVVADDVDHGTTRASLQCSDSRATITVEAPRQARPLVLELGLADTKPEARPRLLALAVAELIATSSLEPSEAQATTPPRPAPPPADDTREDNRPPRLALWLAAGATRGFAPALYAPAFSLGAARRFDPFSVDLELGYEHAQRSTQAQRLIAQDLWLGISPAWHVDVRQLDFGLALGARAGHAWLTASPVAQDLIGHTLAGFFVAPTASASLALRANRHVLPRIALEAAYVVKPVRGFDADGRPLLALRGLWLCALLGVAWAP